MEKGEVEHKHCSYGGLYHFGDGVNSILWRHILAIQSQIKAYWDMSEEAFGSKEFWKMQRRFNFHSTCWLQDIRAKMEDENQEMRANGKCGSSGCDLKIITEPLSKQAEAWIDSES